MRKAALLFIAICMLFSLAVTAGAQSISSAPGWLYVIAVTDSGENGQVDKTARFQVNYRRNPDGGSSTKTATGGQIGFPIEPGYQVERMTASEDNMRIVLADPIELPYEITQSDFDNGLVLRIRLVPIEPAEPDEPDTPITPDDSGTTDGTPFRPLPSQHHSPRLNGSYSGNSESFGRGHTSPGKLKGSQELPAGGVLLNSVSVKKSRPVPQTQTADIRSITEQAVLEAVELQQSQARVSLVNIPLLTPEIQEEIFEAIPQEEDEALPVIIQADTVTPEGIESRMEIDLAEARQAGTAIDTTVSSDVGSAANETVKHLFEKNFINDIWVLTFGQQGLFGIDVSVAIKTELSTLEKTLYFYTYDIGTNEYCRMDIEYFLDQNGYFRFTTGMGNCMIITDALLTPR